MSSLICPIPRMKPRSALSGSEPPRWPNATASPAVRRSRSQSTQLSSFGLVECLGCGLPVAARLNVLGISSPVVRDGRPHVCDSALEGCREDRKPMSDLESK